MRKETKDKKIFPRALWLLPAGLCAGIINGLLGCGGGILSVAALSAVLPKDSDPAARTRDIFAMTVLSVIPMSVSSSLVYGQFGALPMTEFLSYLPAALIGGVIGGFLLDRINTVFLKRVFAALIIYSGVKIFF